ncbi:uncharacterized protein LOC119609812 isoform X2 [Lucilia sericata]|uniref:uncharacterized protein LOC119609812 isoform X2 n=1 Tax=Lucilia sericata TaxID=13632 RepID=UPI0018A865C0|nr:uncharacterized protein LOC119609812 isoform X2 [Lucilia sericata]
MLETTEPCTSKAARLNTLSSNVADNDVEMQELEDNQDSSSLWCIEDDSMFYAQGLKHHSAGKGKSVKSGATTLTKVRIALPEHEQELEEIANMLILEMNTLLCMKSGRVYYFSSVKSMHKVDWLTGVRCMSPCPGTQFSVIRLIKQGEEADVKQQSLLCLEVYKDVPQLGKCCSDQQVLCHSYDISFDVDNLFNCDWRQETYTLTSLITDKRNIEFLKQLVSIGNIFRSKEEVIELEINQEVHIFTVSGNLLLLAGALVAESDSLEGHAQVEDFGIRLLNTYACHIECIRIDCEKNLLIVLLQSGHLDIWYKSQRMLGAIYHQQHQLTQFLYYDYWPAKNIFYFTTPDEVIQLKILTSPQETKEQECIIKETRKSIAGMIACTWVESLQQLICLSFNNIFYRIHFTSTPERLEYSEANETNYENLNNLYALNTKRVKELTAKAQIVNDLIEQPKQLHNGIEKEFEKQQLLSLSTKSEIFQKLFQTHLEYHVNIPHISYFGKDCITIRTNRHYTHHSNEKATIYSLIFLSLKNKHKFLSSIFISTIWYLHITNSQQSLQLHLPFELINKNLCFILDTPSNHLDKPILTNYSLNLLCFVSHQSQHMALKFKLCLETNERTYINLFSFNIQNLPIFHNFYEDIERLLKKHSDNANKTNAVEEESGKNVYKLKHFFKISKNVLLTTMEKLEAQWTSLVGVAFEIYYLHEHLIELNYDDSKEILQISSNYPLAIFYIKMLLLHAQQQQESAKDLVMVDTSLPKMLEMIMSYQSDIEQLYGSLVSPESEEMNSNTISMHLENLQNIYAKIRQEFYDIFR